MITIKNLRNSKPQCEWQVRVDRTSVLGNPFYMSDESHRDEVCDKYEDYFYNMVGFDEDAGFHNIKAFRFNEELRRLVAIYKKHGKLELYCWCAPKRCHAETIKAYIENLL